MEKLKVINASAVTGTCILVSLTTNKRYIVKLDTWKWRNSFTAEIFFTIRGKKFNVVCNMEPNIELMDLIY